MKLAIITSNQLRHKFFIDKIAKNFSVTGVISEEKKRDPSKKGEGTNLFSRVVNYFKEREKSEKEFFESIDFDRTLDSIENGMVSIEAGNLNTLSNVDLLKKMESRFYSGLRQFYYIIGEEIIGMFDGRIINMHLGLSLYYRGSGTNFWPLYDEKLEYVGVTIHYLDKGIDIGNIIIQGRPDIVIGDTPHSIGNKTIIKGVDLMIEILKRFEKGENILGKKQKLNEGKLCLFKDCLPKHIIELEEKFKNGLVNNYLNRINK